VNDPRIQVVHNTTPSYLHVPVTLAAIKAGKHVISDKPLAMTPWTAPSSGMPQQPRGSSMRLRTTTGVTRWFRRHVPGLHGATSVQSSTLKVSICRTG